ncbi:hypothetical protein B0A49_01569 [Cryomyces minteri]|uniref:Uncharacterized protein n=1 Tax=Cryomyces minteri TaxID=331657 RepID=A0A4U0XTG3_9PEZI|nr:hypothetical protein B0A49_01569 [Cryomyces minteri]
MPPEVRRILLEFISEIRNNPEFFADRIANLSQQQLASFMSFRQSLDPIDSVIAHTAPGKATSGSNSTEDFRRTDTWATACAKIITQQKLGSDKFIMMVLDAWAGMREWSGKAGLDLFLMEVLQHGAFLLERDGNVSVRHGSQTAAMPPTKDTPTADELFDKATMRLFEVLGAESGAGGIPNGALEIGSAIFFSSFLLSAIIYPETQGIMTGYHITDDSRQRILRVIATRAQKIVLDMTYNWKQAMPVPPEARRYVEQMISLFKKPLSSESTPLLIPASAGACLERTEGVQPYLMMCPADFITFVKTLFPERRPASMQMDNDFSFKGPSSPASSVSGMSLLQSNSCYGDGSSVSSLGASSRTSDTTSRDPLVDFLGRTPDHGKKISVHQTQDEGNGYDTEDEVLDPGHKAQGVAEEIDSNRTYHELKHGITSLLVEYYVPDGLSRSNGSQVVSGRLPSYRHALINSFARDYREILEESAKVITIETDDWLASTLGQDCVEQLEGKGRQTRGSVSRKGASNAENLSSVGNKSSSFNVPEEQTIDQADTPVSHFTLLDPQPASTHPGPLDGLNPYMEGVSEEGNSSGNNLPYNDAFRHMLHKFATHPNPYSKLQALYKLELMITAYLTSDFLEDSHSARNLTSTLKRIAESSRLESVQTTTPRAESSATPSSFHSSTSRRPYVGPPSTDQIIEVLQDLFRSVDARPRTLFRDLQYIACFVPAQLLDRTAHGKAFWDAGLAALSLKRDVCEIMVEMADRIVAYHTSNRGHSQVSSGAQRQRDAAISSPTPKANNSPTTAGANSDAMSRYSMSDAACLLQISAKEGDCVAQRELATFYLTHPELLPRVMLPLTRPRDVLKAELESLWRRNEDPTRCDPMTMCVAQHWMEASSRGGDGLAKKYLRARDEIEKIP